MRFLSSVLLLALLSHALSVRGQQKPEWIKIAPAEEHFEILFPLQPKVETTELTFNSGSRPTSASGNVYSSSLDAETFMIWSLETSRAPRNQADEIATFLDEYADLVWESLLKPAREAVSQVFPATMSYKSEVSLGVIPGREYVLRFGNAVGATRFYLDGAHLYVLVAVSVSDNSAVQAFFDGFQAKPATETPFLPVAVPTETKSYDHLYKASETTTRAKVIFKPEPQYTERARKYLVRGTVVLTGVFSTDGRVIDIHVVKRLPHGLTEASIEVAKRIRFTPATKDGLEVFQTVQLEYNFNFF